VYLVSAAVVAHLAQIPTQRQAVRPANLLDGTAATEMVAVVIANEPAGIQLQYLVYVSVRDTLASLLLLLAALLSNLVN